MTPLASDLLPNIRNRLDQRIKEMDEERWLSSRYARREQRETLIALYSFYLELARIRLAVSDPVLGAIRYQWWRDALNQISESADYQHEVMTVLKHEITAGHLSLSGLLDLLDLSEQAYEAKDRRLEPEGKLAALACKVLVPAHNWARYLVDIAPHWAALRRGEKIGCGPVLPRAPKSIRPAIAHFRLRHDWGEGRQPDRLRRRFIVLRGIQTGKV